MKSFKNIFSLRIMTLVDLFCNKMRKYGTDSDGLLHCVFIHFQGLWALS